MAILSETRRGPVIYTGQFGARLEARPDGLVLDAWDVLPIDLGSALETATTLVVMDPMSFPFEVLTGDHWDIPMVIALPDGLDADTIVAVLGDPILRHLTFFDGVVLSDTEVWRALRRRYGWAETQRRTEPLNAIVAAEPDFEDDDETADAPDYETISYWSQRGERMAATRPAQAICSIRHDLLTNKAMHRIQAAALEPLFHEATIRQPRGMKLRVVDIGCGVGRWAASFHPQATRFAGLDVSEGMIQEAARNFPEAAFRCLAADVELGLGDETVDLAFTVTVLHHNPPDVRRRMLRQMWRAVRPGGWLVFLEDFVTKERAAGATVYPMRIGEFVAELLEASRGAVTLGHVEALRYPYDDFHRAGVVAVSKLAVPKRW